MQEALRVAADLDLVGGDEGADPLEHLAAGGGEAREVALAAQRGD